MSRDDDGYSVTTTRRSRYNAPSHFAIIEREGRDPDAQPAAAGDLHCKSCGQAAPVLHADPHSSSPQRTICGVCEGRANRRLLGDGQ